jgi:predicted ABC-type transport system involved in lysophospholipase L1 biosynthesis ATPase subunit
MNSAAVKAAPAVDALGVCKRYTIGRAVLPVLRGVDLSVAPGEAVAVIGASGAGKSTLLHILGALDTPDSGAVRLFGEDIAGMGQSRRARIRASVIGFVFQSYHLLPEMDVLENVALPTMALPFTSRLRARRRAAAAELLERVGLADRIGHTPRELSGGEQQRVAIARALVNEPSVVLADEPTGNLDDETGAHVLSCLFGLARGRGRTLIVVTHSEKVAAACDRRVRLAEGRMHPA